MLKLRNIDEEIELELRIVGYECPDHAHNDWCLVQAIVSQQNKRFEAIEPALESTELATLLEWFHCLSHGKLPRFATQFFTEPCLAFEFLAFENKTVRIGVTLSHEMKPPFQRRKSQKDSQEWKATFDLSSNELSDIICEIESVMKQYPVRTQNEAVRERMSLAAERHELYKRLSEITKNDIEKQLVELELKELRLRARQMKLRSMPLDIICKRTGLSENEINGL